MAKLKVGIYHLRFSDGAPSIVEIVKIIQALPGKKRAAQLMEDPIRPRERITISDQCCVLDFSRFSPTDRIPTGDVEGNEGEIRFAPDDLRPCKYTAILLDQHSNTLYIHEGAGVGHTVVAKYLKAVANLASLYTEVILHDVEALERLRDKHHRRFKVRIAGIQDASVLRAQGLGDEAILKTIQVHRSPNALISLHYEKNEPGFLDNVMETASALIGWNNLPQIFGKKRPVKEIIIGDDEETENVVNLLDDRMTWVEELELERGQSFTDAQRHRAVRNAFERYRNDLRRRYPVSSNVPG
jgi:hypothetical protein